MTLRLAGYGHSTSLFKPWHQDGRDYLVNNDEFSLRFFPPQMTRDPSAFRMAAEKPPGAFRIFILGESAAMGDPEPAFGAGRYLEALLRDRFPGADFEIINVSITAINSHVILPIARDCARQHGDLWIVYVGNNEMVGPFGAATVFGAQAPPLGIVRLSLAIRRTRTGQLLADLSRKLKDRSGNTGGWGGMQMFIANRVPPNDSRREVVYRNFERNLADIVQTGLDSGAKVLLNTVAVNLRDCPPFASLADTNLPPADRARFDQLFADAGRAQDQGQFTEAIQLYEQAVRLEPNRADVAFRQGECLVQLTNFAAATAQFQRACDLDALPFRADSRINDAIVQVGRRFAGPHLVLLDTAAILATNQPAGVCGQETFYEHVHFDFDGSYHLARAWAADVERFLPEAIRSRATGNWASQDTCERQLGLSGWNRNLVLQSVLKRFAQPPLSGQDGNAARVATLQERINALRQQMTPAAVAQAREKFEQAIARAPDDHHLRESYAAFLQSTGDLPAATAQWRRVLELLPHDYLTLFQLGRLLALQSQWSEAESYLTRALELRPTFPDAWRELGLVRFGERNYVAALMDFDRARTLQPSDPRVYYDSARAFSLLKRSDESVASFREAIRLDPAYWEAHYALGGELGNRGQIAEAREQFEFVVRQQPDFAAGHLNLGVAWLKLDHPEQAARAFEETLRLEPTNAVAMDYLQQARKLMNRPR